MLFLQRLADASGVSQKDVKKVLEGLSKAIPDEIKENPKAALKIGKVLVLKRKERPAKPEAVRNIFGKEYKIPAKPTSIVVKADATKHLRDLVCS